MNKAQIMMGVIVVMAIVGLYDAATGGPISQSEGSGSSARPILASGNCAGIHVVEAGDTLGSIAARFGHSVDALAQASGIRNPNKIVLGDKICLPKSPSAQAAASNCRLKHTVAPGEYLGTIAAKYGTTSAELATRNGLANPNYIGVGWELCISP